MIKSNQVKQLREKTSASMMECKKSLEEAKGDEALALNILRQKGKNIAFKKAARETKQGLIESYVHNNDKIGVLLEINCETDFVARNQEFRELAHDLALHIAGMDPQCIEPKDVSEEEISLLTQPFVKNPDITIGDLIQEKIAKLGENIKVSRFIRYEL